MKNIKSLYLEAKIGGTSSSISEYQKAVQNLFESDPRDYLSGLKYIISSGSGISTFVPFIERYGLPIVCYEDARNCIQECMDKLEEKDMDVSKYKEALNYLEKFKEKYEGAFLMQEGYGNPDPEDHPISKEKYLDDYYSFHENGIQGRNLPAGMMQRYREYAIPDVIVTANQCGKLNTILDFLESKADVFGSPLFFQYLNEAVRPFASSRYPYIQKIEERSAQYTVDQMLERNHQILRESILTENADLYYEYSEDELNALSDLITFKEYQVVCTEDADQANQIQNEIYQLYSELDGIVTESGDVMDYISESAKSSALRKAIKKIKKLQSKIEASVNMEITKELRENKDSILQDTKCMIFLGSKDKYFTKKYAFQNRFLKKCLLNEKEYGDKTVNDLYFWVSIHKTTTKKNQDPSREGSFKQTASKVVRAGIQKFLEDNVVRMSRSKTPTNRDELGVWQTLFPLKVSKTFLEEEYSLFESMEPDDFDENDVTEDVADEIIPLLPGAVRPMKETPRYQKTGEVPGWLGNNHNLRYGEDDTDGNPDGDKTDEDSKDMEDYRRPSAKPTSDDTETHDKADLDLDDDNDNNDDMDTEDEKEFKQKDQGAVNNYYYYTYNHSMNKNSNSYNRKDTNDYSKHDDHHSYRTDDHSVRNTKHDDHSIHRSHSDDLSYNNDAEESAKPWELQLFSDHQSYVEGKFLDTIGDTVKKMGAKIRGFRHLKKTLPNLQSLDRPDIINAPMPLTLPGTDIPLDIKTPLKESLDYNIESMIQDPPFLESSKRLGLSKNDVKNIVNRLRSKFHVDIIFINNQSDLIKAVGPTSVMLTSRKTINDMIRGKRTNGKFDNVLSGYEGEFEKVIVVNPAMIAKFGVQTPDGLEMLISHEYGHILTIDQLSKFDWVEYAIKRQMIASLAQVAAGVHSSFFKRAMAEANVYYYKLKPERLANETAKVDPVKLTEVLLHIKPTGNIPGIQMQKIVDWKIDPVIIRMNESNPSSLSELSKKDLIANVTITRNLYRSCITDSSILNKLNQALDSQLKYAESLTESTIFTEAVGDADDLKPESDHPVRDTMMDLDKEMMKKKAKTKEKITQLKATGSTIVKPIKRSVSWVDQTISNWKDKNTNKVREKMADPQQRSGLMNAAKKAVAAGSLAKAGLLFNPIFLFLSVTKNVGKKDREFRIRNEMIGEIKTEIEVLDEKISDAKEKSDYKAKYELMRLKNQLQKKLIRVGGTPDMKKII